MELAARDMTMCKYVDPTGFSMVLKFKCLRTYVKSLTSKPTAFQHRFAPNFEIYVKPLSAAIPYCYARLSYLTLVEFTPTIFAYIWEAISLFIVGIIAGPVPFRNGRLCDRCYCDRG